MGFIKGLLSARRELRRATRDATTIETSNALFNEILCRSAADLRMLMTDTPRRPLSLCRHPLVLDDLRPRRADHRAAMLWCDPGVARGVLRRLAAHQAKKTDPRSDAQPGKILHEMRDGEMAALSEVPFGLYYGSVDATPLFVLLAGLYVERTGDQETLAAAVAAYRGGARLDRRDGRSRRRRLCRISPRQRAGPRQSGLEGLPRCDLPRRRPAGRRPHRAGRGPGLRLCRQDGDRALARRLGRLETAQPARSRAERLAERFEAAFWCPELGTYALALDGAKQPCRVRTSNAGQLLFTGIAQPERAALVGDGLLAPRFFSGWGIRTVAKGEARYNPMSYHNGSIWPHDNALIALGLARYGLKRPVGQLFKGLFDAATYMDLRRLPELFCGFQRQRNRGPTLYPVACSPQAWASATPFSLIEASLGLELDPRHHEVRFRNPGLPPFLDEVTLRNLQLGGSSVDIKVRRHGDDVSLEILRTRGTRLQISIVSSR